MKTIDTLPVESSQIHSIGYDAETETLAVRFKDRKTAAPTSLYHYTGFTQANFDAPKTADSLGSHFYKHIKPFPDRFPYVCVEKIPAPAVGAEAETAGAA
ncbi:KTSC domain-containing protein [Burkholderia sp. BCCIQ04A]|uniref:KTSC domain-containing protein n=1 Tax=Burkholderia anthinoferrum TaxID=3090833 RepID=A0ABU5WTJ5_9BURK|nr:MULTISPECIES: KTSC domain-containing protein [Burkholderia]MEB2535865.1 KTSC domain-containing protein [Burkholderia anthinoferrum]MEB2561993.1 KTSC domain-containing protein [Burkholderia anthinoferrum]MEB2582294.1 KTSC domain-containing protein [Burkholderia anthinoferrum]MDF3115841.1 KTSC domain-containing protein [Burkholderia semiarida]MEB2632619.1 KTSC domain-containing protein [Burkholderia anthinoferrum]